MRTPSQGISYTDKDYEAFRASMIKNLQIKMPEYTDLRQSDAGIVILELLAQGLDIISFYEDVIANEAFLVTEEQRSNALKWCQMLGYIPRPSTPSRFKQVFVLSSVQEKETVIPAGTVVRTVGTSTEPEVKFETTDDLFIPAGKLGNEKDSLGNYLYTVDIEQGTSVNGELLGTSSGTADQRFLLNYTPVIQDSVYVYVNEGSGFEKWTRVDNFVDSGPDSKHYVVNLSDNDEATVVFGNGIFGKIPYKYTNGIFCDYKIGGGTQGNVGAMKIVEMDTNLALVSSTFNPELPYETGQNKETLEEIKRNAPVAYTNLWGALTLSDFANVILLNFPDVQFAISERDPENQDNIFIYLYLKDEAELTEDIKKSILSIFDENEGGRKIVGSDEIVLKYANFVPLDMVCSLVVKDRYSQNSVKKEVEDYLNYYFKKGNYPFDKELSISELASSVMSPETAISGIRSFKITSPSDDILVPKVGDIYYLNSLNISVSGGE